MQFRRSGQRDDRRRRVLIDETSDSKEARSRRSSSRKSETGASYSEEARSEGQLRFVDLLPVRRWVLALFLITGVLTIAAIISLHNQLPNWSTKIHARDLAAFNVQAPASIGAWFSSSLLLLAAIASLQVYALRRYKVDDYRGRYRVWLWTALVLGFASIDASTHIHLILRGVMVHYTGQALYGDGTIWWILLYSMVMGSLAIRMMIEMRHSRIAVASLLVASLVYCSGVAFQLGWLTLGEPSSDIVAKSSNVMLGHLMVLFAIWFYARHVYLDAHGHLTKSSRESRSKEPAKRRSRSQQESSASAAAKIAEQTVSQVNQQIDREELAEVEDELLETSHRRAQRKPKREKTATSDVLQMQDEYADDASNRMSKSERRALKRQRRQRRAA